MIGVDERRLKIQGRWHYCYDVLEVSTDLPVLTTLLPSRSQWASRWISRQLCLLKKVSHVIIRDGLQAYAYLILGAKSVPRRLTGDFSLTSVAGPYMLGSERA
jgi:hypothetical protein